MKEVITGPGNTMRLAAVCCLTLALLGCEQQSRLIKPERAPTTETIGALAEKRDPLKTLASLTQSVSTGGDLLRVFTSGIIEEGATDASATLTVFTEYHCGYCHRFRAEYMNRLREDFIDAKELKVRFVPGIIAKYPNSADAMKGLLCAMNGQKGLRMDEILTSRSSRHRSSLLEYATETGLNEEAFSACLDSTEAEDRKSALLQAAKELEVTLYPTFFVNDEVIIGLPSYADLRGEIEAALSRE